MLATTVFRSNAPAALDLAVKAGVETKVLNPGSASTYHPKLYLARYGDGTAGAIIGSANMRGGLAANVEVAAVIRGSARSVPLAAAWTVGEEL